MPDQEKLLTIAFPRKPEYYQRKYCAYCGARVKGPNTWPHDDDCPMKQ